MIDKEDEVVIIGGGPAGLAAALGASKNGVNSIILDKEERLGGILNQCIHDGFGLEIFEESLTGPEYASRYKKRVKKNKNIEFWPESAVLDIKKNRKVILSSEEGVKEIKPGAIVLAMGCREKTREELRIPGDRPSGVYTAGTAQRLINMKNVMVGKEAVVLGSGDVGLIIARRMTLEGAVVKGVVESLPYSSGLPRNVQQCLKDFDIPLHFNRTVTNIHGNGRLNGVTVSRVDEEGNPISGTGRKIKCDTLLLSAGLIPKNELSMKAGIKLSKITKGPIVDNNLETNVDGIFACGNVLHVHDLVDYATEEALEAGEKAANYILDELPDDGLGKTIVGEGVRYVLPQRIIFDNVSQLSFRVEEPCRRKKVRITCEGDVIKEKTFKGLHPAQMVKMKVDSDKVYGNLKVEVSE